jgi:NADPH:quinone reductase-like Zn-dependent oxidoreductase
MKAAIFEAPGLDNLKVIDNVDEPKIGDRDVLIKVKLAGVNPKITLWYPVCYQE